MRTWLPLVVLAGGFWAAAAALRASGFDLAAVLPDRGARGQAVFLAAATGAMLIGLPRPAAAFAGGAAFGPALGGLLAWIATVVSCGLGYAAARAAWRRPVRVPSFLGRANAGLIARPFVTTAALRNLPVGHNMGLTLFAGAARVPWARFLLGSAAGYIPHTVVFALIGGGAAGGPARWALVVLGVLGFALSAALMRRGSAPARAGHITRV